MKGNDSTFKKFQGGHTVGHQKCGTETFKTSSRPAQQPQKDKGKVSSKGKSMKY